MGIRAAVQGGKVVVRKIKGRTRKQKAVRPASRNSRLYERTAARKGLEPIAKRKWNKLYEKNDREMAKEGYYRNNYHDEVEERYVLDTTTDEDALEEALDVAMNRLAENRIASRWKGLSKHQKDLTLRNKVKEHWTMSGLKEGQLKAASRGDLRSYRYYESRIRKSRYHKD